VVGQEATTLQKRYVRETTPGPRPHPFRADALVPPARPLTPVTSETLEETTHTLLHRQATGLEADLPLHQGRMGSTVKRPGARLRHPTRRALPTPVHSGQTRSTAELHAARLPLSVVQEHNAKPVL
jgi:hypothetical protein